MLNFNELLREEISKMKNTIAIVGEYREGYQTHKKLNDSLEHVKEKFGYDFDYEWISTLTVAQHKDEVLKKYCGIWSANGSPFLSLEGSLYAITFARINNIPHLGTCGGFQHRIIEFARNVLGVKEAQHEEYDANASSLYINKLACSLAGKKMKVYLKEDSKAFLCYNQKEISENYYCNFGINPQFRNELNHPRLLISGVDESDDIRIIEMPENKFFVATVFVPQTNSTIEVPHPLVHEFLKACLF
jgi:CTP synthase (UTP-ammonia lyase)